MHANKAQISSIVQSSKMKVLCHKIYENYSSKIVGRLYLPLREIIEIMKTINIVPKLITMSKFMYICNWHMRRREGYNQEEFVAIQVAVGIELGGVA